jgi:outer membrane protein assembly factor BamB
MYKLTQLLFAYTILVFSSCCDPIVPPIEPPDPEPIDTVFQIKWDVFIEDSTREYLPESPQIYKDLVILPVGSSSQNPTNFIIAYDKYTGKQVWKKDFGQYNWRSFYEYSIKGNLLIGSTINQVYAFNLDTREVEWFHKGSFDPFVTLIGDYAYTTHQGEGYVYLTRFNIHTGTREEVFSRQDGTYLHPSYSPPVLYMDSVSKDSLLIFKITFYSSLEAFSPQNLVVYNLSKRKVKWEKEAFSPTNSAHYVPATIHGDDVIVVSDWHAYKYDIMTGDSIWKYQIENRTTPINGVVRANPILYGDKFIIQEVSSPMHCVDANTGKAIWINQKGSTSSIGDAIVHKDIIVNTSGDGLLRAYDLKNGFTFLSRKSPSGKGFIFKMTYDIETDMYYTIDFGRVYGFKINKPK